MMEFPAFKPRAQKTWILSPIDPINPSRKPLNPYTPLKALESSNKSPIEPLQNKLVEPADFMGYYPR